MQNAAERMNRLRSAQFLDPLFTGDWTPERLAKLGPSTLPRFTPEQSAALLAAKVAINGSEGKLAACRRGEARKCLAPWLSGAPTA